MKKVLSILAGLFAVAQFAIAQNVTVTGSVTDENGQPLPGAGIILHGTTTGTEADIDGHYSISVPDGSTLDFSFFGYIGVSRKVSGTAPVNVQLNPDTQSIEETVVVGYGVQKKSDVTGAISSVKAEDLQNRTITTVQGGLQGKTAGVQVVTTSGAPGAESTIRVRGYSSNSDSKPLYVVDGLRTTNISYLDPNDIQSIEVLKDAASAAIYGAQAGNGVVLITTKRASEGVTKISYDFQYTVNKVARIPKVLNAKEYINWAVNEGGLVSQSRIDQYYDGTTDTDWADVAFENGSMQRHNVSISGATKKGSLYASFGDVKNDGPIIGKQDTFDRLTGSLNASYNLFSWLQFTTNNSFGRFHGKRVREGGMYSMLSSVIQMDPLTPVIYSKNDVPAHIQALIDAGHLFLTDKNGDYYSMSPFQESNNINPYIMRDAYHTESEGLNVHGSTSLNLKPFKTLTITSRVGYDYMNRSSYSLQWPHVVNTDTNYDYVVIDASSGSNAYWQWENFINYDETFGKHHLSAMAGMAFDKRSTYDVTGSVSGNSSSNIGITKLDRNYAYFANQTGTAIKTISGGEKIHRADLSYYGRLSYDYANKYFFQASLRGDAADLSILPDGHDTRWGYFPALSGGWTVSRENFFKNLNLKAVDFLKLRASWGQNGSIAGLGNYMYASTISSDIQYSLNASGYNVGSVPSSTGNYKLKWETSEQTDLGLDLRMFNDRLTFGMDWYKKKTKDLIMTTIISSLDVGNTISPLNAGNVENKGWEFDLGWHDHIGEFNYGVNANISTLKNEVTYIYPTLTRVAGNSGGSGVTTYFEKGHPLWYMRGYKYEGVDPSNGYPIFKDVDENGVINDDDKVEIGSGIPDITYGVTLNMSWKGFDFLVFANGTSGNEICYAVPRSTRMQANTLKYFYDRRWTTPGKDAKYIGAKLHDYDKYCQSSALVFDGSYFKIKQIQLGYSLPKDLISKIYLTNARVYVSLDDYFTFTDYPGFDPEVSLSGNGLGLDYGQYPTTKKIVFGLNITF